MHEPVFKHTSKPTRSISTYEIDLEANSHLQLLEILRMQFAVLKVYEIDLEAQTTSCNNMNMVSGKCVESDFKYR